MHASFGNINSIKIGTQINTKNSEKEEKFNLLSHKQCLSIVLIMAGDVNVRDSD